MRDRMRKKQERLRETMASFREDEASYEVAAQEEAELKKLIQQEEVENLLTANVSYTQVENGMLLSL
jgi:flagellar motor protein MotB